MADCVKPQRWQLSALSYPSFSLHLLSHLYFFLSVSLSRLIRHSHLQRVPSFLHRKDMDHIGYSLHFQFVFPFTFRAFPDCFSMEQTLDVHMTYGLSFKPNEHVTIISPIAHSTFLMQAYSLLRKKVFLKDKTPTFSFIKNEFLIKPSRFTSRMLSITARYIYFKQSICYKFFFHFIFLYYVKICNFYGRKMFNVKCSL